MATVDRGVESYGPKKGDKTCIFRQSFIRSVFVISASLRCSAKPVTGFIEGTAFSKSAPDAIRVPEWATALFVKKQHILAAPSPFFYSNHHINHSDSFNSAFHYR